MSFFAVDSGQDTIHSRTRLNILVYLSTVTQSDFVTIRNELKIADGSLSQQLEKLEEAGLILVTKAIVGERPKTFAALTNAGEAALGDYMKAVRKLLNQVPKDRVT